MLLLLTACRHEPAVDPMGVSTTDPAAEVIPGAPDAPPDEVPGDTMPEPVDTAGDTAVDPDIDTEYEAFFDMSVIQSVRIELESSAMRALERDPSTYVEGAAEINGVPFAIVGVRLKGSSTLQGFSGKPSLKLKLNEYVPGQKYAGLERVTLNNMVSDTTQSKEVINYSLYAASGMVGPRANFAQVWINDELYGLYTNLESMDDHWLERRFDDADGDFWGTAASGADFDRANVRCDWCYWVSKSGDADVSKLLSVKEAIDDASDDFQASLGGVIDADQFLDYWAWNTVIGNGDGYPWTTNDVLIYADPDDGGRFDFSPWGWTRASTWRQRGAPAPRASATCAPAAPAVSPTWSRGSAPTWTHGTRSAPRTSRRRRGR